MDSLTPAQQHRNNGNDWGDGVGIITDTNIYEQTLFWIHQSKWQQELLARYGNT